MPPKVRVGQSKVSESSGAHPGTLRSAEYLPCSPDRRTFHRCSLTGWSLAPPTADRLFAVEASPKTLGVSNSGQFPIRRDYEAGVQRRVQEVDFTLKCRRAMRWQFVHQV